MQQVLVADDNPTKRQQLVELAEQIAPQRSTVHVASSAKEGKSLIERNGRNYQFAIIDFDFEGEAMNGADLVLDLRQKNHTVKIVCATARGCAGSFGDARAQTQSAGADVALSTMSAGFESELRSALGA